MNDKNNTAAKQVKENGTNLKNDIVAKAQDTINKVKAQASNKAEQISETTAAYKAKVSDNLSGAAEKVNQISHRAGDALNASSEYVKNFDLAETTQQVKKTIKQKPGFSLVIAGIFGLLIGLLIGRRTPH